MGLFRKNKDREERAVATYESLVGYQLRSANSWAPPVVSETGALGIGTAYRCVSLIADAIAGLPIRTYRGEERVDNSPLIDQPNPPETRVETLFGLVSSLVLRGNAYALVGGYDRTGWPTALSPVSPNAIYPFRKDGKLFYQLGGDTVLDAAEVLHVRLYTQPGSDVGLGPLSLHQMTMGAAAEGEEYAARFWEESAIPALQIVAPDGRSITQEESDRLKAEWAAKHGNMNREPAVMSGGLKLDRVSLTPEEAQFIEARNFSVAEVARIFGVPPYMVNAPTSSTMTYSNTEHESIHFVRWTLNGIVRRFESALTRWTPRGQEVRFDLGGLMRADMRTRWDTYQIGIRGGWLTPNEARELERLEPLAGLDQTVWPPYRAQLTNEELGAPVDNAGA
jgi:HK97 family phage portal protein